MIRGIIEVSFLDWDGKVVMVLYTPSCNFRCPFCHNWELMDNPERYPEKSWEDIKALLEEHRDFLDGVCFTGGEPLMEPDLEEWLRKVKDMGLLVKLDTNGSFPDVLADLLEKKLINYIAMDVKMPPNGDYARAAGTETDVEAMKRSIDIIRNSGVGHEFRTTVVPGIHTMEDVVEIAKFLGGGKYVLQQFVPYHALDEALREIKPYDNETIIDMADVCSEYVDDMAVRGLR
ncbi:MAG: anaerobic ribonucleoside-triphosphate reductase activating protein [Candidatus Thermoplasmatota archaeon]|nr:anaerobic ribonucleoside-triphosphate reductase activating protein [Euryarchaeota archaeon]MBU4032541.1 anaerobic ribonucleoside-triphosphate reductase activating protein [Candidatus Thermoplasmatota archaeon]MBU4072014.1 anaerobic ribonucleoside-triphosphate reductase activating protein [Candidatus Thermoplasmatota archaeon]MBU4144545.1 anaerobic ribonucleoside-triphosphate reductase activating protein [Candidatus Thermoplasmatota archaeon]MBU4592094.1 anaerobic ribonucleoside-triphosphate 